MSVGRVVGGSRVGLGLYHADPQQFRGTRVELDVRPQQRQRRVAHAQAKAERQARSGLSPNRRRLLKARSMNMRAILAHEKGGLRSR